MGGDIVCLPVSEHLAQAGLLVRPNDRCGLEIDIKIGIYGIIPEVIFLEHWIFQKDTAFLHILEFGNPDGSIDEHYPSLSKVT